MKILTISQSDSNGGAARAAYRIHKALRQQNIDSHMWVNDAGTNSEHVCGPDQLFIQGKNKLRKLSGSLIPFSMRSSNKSLHSPAILSSQWPEKINSSDCDIVHMHWINREMLSISDIAKITKPIVWTLHDMWPFCGAEHYTEDLRWKSGYFKHNRPDHEYGLDINRWVWERKRKWWHKPMHIVTPSHWLGDCVRQSYLMKGMPVRVIKNPIDTDVWSPVDKYEARKRLGLPVDVPLLLFGAMGGGADKRKGVDLLGAALKALHHELPDIQLMILGQDQSGATENNDYPVHYLGHIGDDNILREIYSAADAMVIPSRQDNLPNTGVESLSCATPVIAFDVCGLPDIVRHKHTGYLARAFDIDDLAKGILWVLSEAVNNLLSEKARNDAISRFSCKVVAKQYAELYENVHDAVLCE